jgi:hypothetical protein
MYANHGDIRLGGCEHGKLLIVLFWGDFVINLSFVLPCRLPTNVCTDKTKQITKWLAGTGRSGTCLVFKITMSEVKREKKGNGRGRRRRRNGGPPRAPRNGKNGDKKVTVPVAFSRSVVTAKPKMDTFPNGDVLIKHREFITDVVSGTGGGGATDYKVLGLPINPGQAGTFPWLSRVAANYESYLFHKLKFVYATEAPSTLAGTAMLTVDYDATDAPPGDKVQFMSYRSSVRSAVWTNCVHVSLAEDLKKSKTYYVRNGVQPPETDLKTMDVGNLFYATQGVGLEQFAVGELYVEYEVKLMTPVYENSSSFGVVGGHVINNGTLALDNPFGDGLIHVVPGSAGLTMGPNSILRITQAGNYYITAVFAGTAFTGADPVIATDAFLVRIGQIVNGAGGITIAYYRTVVTNLGAFYQWDLTGLATTVTNANLYIGQIPLTVLA